MEKKTYCINCKRELSELEIRKEKCFYCSQRRSSIGIMVFGTLVAIFFFIYGIIAPIVNADYYDEFNVGLMLFYWGIGFGCLLGYWILYTLFTKLDIIIGQLKSK